MIFKTAWKEKLMEKKKKHWKKIPINNQEESEAAL